ncbi:MAG: hypothetical protein PHR19_08965 [Bacteroidales bacterium]|nr:hypothetical protein [Bacteroidales bacterium]
MEDFDYKAMEALAPEQLKSGKPLLGKGGAFAPLLEKIINAALEGEMDAHMDCEERSFCHIEYLTINYFFALNRLVLINE